jgi:NADH-quinone oxidoreductase subunit J
LTLRIIFLVIASLGVLSALGAVLARNLVHAALFLVAFFFTVACQFVLLEAEFLAAIQVLVYIGAVAILILFGIMLTRNIQGDETTGGHWVRKVPAAIVAAAVLAVLVAGIRGESGGRNRPAWVAMDQRPGAADPRTATLTSMAPAAGIELMTRYGLAFEIAGLLLTAAVVGAIALAHGDPEDEPGRRGRAGTARATSPPDAGNGPAPRPEPAVEAAR